jgi:hypothetical protein
VSPTLLEESVESFGPFFSGFDPVPAPKAALGFIKSVEGLKLEKHFTFKGPFKISQLGI